MPSDGKSKIAFIIVKTNEEVIYSRKGTNMNQEPGTKSKSEAEELSPAAKEFAHTIAAALVKHWQQEHQTKPSDSGEISRSSHHCL